MSQLNYRTFEEVRTRVLEHGFDGPPNDKAAYSNAPAYLLGIILERVGGAILPALANKYFFEPLEMSDTTFFPNIGVYETPTIAPTEIQEGKEIRGVVHDESARIFSQARRAVGHAGLFSTALDTLKFLEALLTGKYSAVAEGAEKGLGWQLEQEWFMGAHFSKGAFGKTGFTGTSVLVDRAKGIGLVILSNRCYPKRPADAASLASAINIFRKDIADIVLS
jgi:CubicO group peptidase (beta-lactamase class C family)